MSSNYTIISCAQWDRMQETIASADAYQVKSQEELARLRALEDAQRARLDRLTLEHQQAVAQSLEALAASCRAAQARLQGQARARMDGQAGQFAGQLEDLRRRAAQTEERAAALTEEADRLAEAYSGMIAPVLAGLGQGEARARATLEEADRLLGQIRALHPEALLPEEYAALEALRASIAANLEAGDFQAALAVSQGSVLRAGRLLTRLAVLNQRQEARTAVLRAQASELQLRAERLASPGGALAFELDGEAAELPYDISFWSHGAFDGIAGQIAALSARLQSPAPLGEEELRAAAGQLAQLGELLDRCDREARRELAGAAAVDHTVQRLYNGLNARGWTLTGSGRQDGDSRKPYSMTYDDGLGNTVSIVVAGGEDPETPSFFYEAFSPSEGMAAAVKADVGAALRAEGLIPGPVTERDDCALNHSPGAFIARAEREAAQLSARRQERLRRALGQG